MTADLHSENWNQGSQASMYSLLLAIHCAQKVTNLYIDLTLVVNTSNIAWTNLREIALQKCLFTIIELWPHFVTMSVSWWSWISIVQEQSSRKICWKQLIDILNKNKNIQCDEYSVKHWECKTSRQGIQQYWVSFFWVLTGLLLLQLVIVSNELQYIFIWSKRWICVLFKFHSH
jgi:hypothetical protein